MDQTTKQPTGNFYAPVNRTKLSANDKSIFIGTLTKPDDEAALTFALWAL